MTKTKGEAMPEQYRELKGALIRAKVMIGGWFNNADWCEKFNITNNQANKATRLLYKNDCLKRVKLLGAYRFQVSKTSEELDFLLAILQQEKKSRMKRNRPSRVILQEDYVAPPLHILASMNDPFGGEARV